MNIGNDCYYRNLRLYWVDLNCWVDSEAFLLTVEWYFDWQFLGSGLNFDQKTILIHISLNLTLFSSY